MTATAAQKSHGPVITEEKQFVIDTIVETINTKLHQPCAGLSSNTSLIAYDTQSSGLPQSSPWSENSVAAELKKQGWAHVSYRGASYAGESASYEKWYLSTEESYVDYLTRKSAQESAAKVGRWTLYVVTILTVILALYLE